ncbi:MAG: response regulator transcription factor [Thiolinea sp.]
MHLLLVEDDHELSEHLRTRLKQHGFVVDVADNGQDGEFMGDEIAYEAVILDIGLPERSGLSVLQHWRQRGNRVPVILLTARDAWHERVDGFKAGADDYLGKPFHFEELLARLQALIRRVHQANAEQEQLRCCGLVLDEAHQQVITASGEHHTLTATEFRLLRYFMLHPDVILSKFRLTEHVCEGDADRDSNVIEVYVRHLRRMLGNERILTRRGQGYIFPDPGKAPTR